MKRNVSIPFSALAAATFLVALAPSVAAQSAASQPAWRSAPWAGAIERLLPLVVEARRSIHAHPELGERELRTAALVAEQLTSFGLEVRTGIGGTGVVAVLTGGRPGAVVAYRADMDALPIREQTGLAFASTRTDTWDGKEVGVMHACGHDMHTAIGLGVAGVLASDEVRPNLPGRVVFLFQPAEESMPDPGLHGAARMLADGAFEDPRPAAVFGLHVNPLLALGTASAIPKGAMAAVDRFTIAIQGKQAHGAYPHAGIDPVVVASHVVTALQTIVSRNVDTHEPVVVTVGKIEAGNRFNIIPDTAELVGTIRTHDETVQALVHRRLEALATGIAASFGATATVTIDRVTPVTWNDPELVERMRPSFERALGPGQLVPERPHMGGEDFAFFAREVPGLFWFLGVSDFSKGRPTLVHTPTFAPEEDALVFGVGTSVQLLVDWLGAEAP